MAALTAPRTDGATRSVDFDKRPLAASVKAIKGGLFASIAGYYKPATGAPGEVILGRFVETIDNTAGAAGALSAEVQFFRSRKLFLLKNDTVAPVVVANREGYCSVKDDQTATLLTAAKGAQLVVYDVVNEWGTAGDGVWVEYPHPAAAPGAGVPVIQAGTGTLGAGGTVTISGVVLTATSRITFGVKDPGAGVLTNFAFLDAPAASRNVGAGTFVVNAVDDAGAVLATARCTFDYTIVG